MRDGEWREERTRERERERLREGEGERERRGRERGEQGDESGSTERNVD